MSKRRQPDNVNNPIQADSNAAEERSTQSLTADIDKRPTTSRQAATQVERPTQASSSDGGSLLCNQSIIASPCSGRMTAERTGDHRSTGGTDVTQVAQPREKLDAEGGPVIHSDNPAPDSRRDPLDGQSVGVIQTRRAQAAKVNKREMTERGNSDASGDLGSSATDSQQTTLTEGQRGEGNKQTDADELTDEQLKRTLKELADIDITDKAPDEQEGLMKLDADDFRKEQ